MLLHTSPTISGSLVYRIISSFCVWLSHVTVIPLRATIFMLFLTESGTTFSRHRPLLSVKIIVSLSLIPYFYKDSRVSYTLLSFCRLTLIHLVLKFQYGADKTTARVTPKVGKVTISQLISPIYHWINVQ